MSGRKDVTIKNIYYRMESLRDNNKIPKYQGPKTSSKQSVSVPMDLADFKILKTSNPGEYADKRQFVMNMIDTYSNNLAKITPIELCNFLHISLGEVNVLMADIWQQQKRIFAELKVEDRKMFYENGVIVFKKA
jgi:hypothetical protein